MAASKLGDSTGRMLKTSGFSLASLTAFILYQAISIPVFLKSYGTSHYAVWLILYSVPAFFTIVDFGIPDVVGAELVLLHARGSHIAAGALFRKLTRWGLLWISLIAVTFAAAVHHIHVTSALGINSISDGRAANLLSVLMLWLCLTTIWGICGAGYRGMSRYQRYFGLSAAVRTIEYCWLISGAAAAVPFEILSLGLVATRSGFLLAASVDLRHIRATGYHEDLQPSDAGMDIKEGSVISLTPFVIPGISSLAFGVGNALQNQAMIILVARVSGATAMVIVNTIRTLTNSIYQFNLVLNAGVIQEAGEAYGRHDRMRLHALTRQIVGLVCACDLVLGVLVLSIGPWFLGLWTHHVVKVSSATLLVFVLSTVTDCVWYAITDIARAANRHSAIAVTYVLSCGVSLPLCFGLLPVLGLVAVPVSLFSTSIFVNWSACLVVGKLLAWSPFEVLMCPVRQWQTWGRQFLAR